jgi:hypothetical protein
MSKDLLDYFAKLGLGGDLSRTNPPPKREKPFAEMLNDNKSGKLMKLAVETYFEELLPFFTESVRKFGLEELKRKYCQLFEIGVLDIYFHGVGPKPRKSKDEQTTLVALNLIVWDGNKYQFYTDCVEKFKFARSVV